MYPDRVVSGMRPTGLLHLGHYHGALKNWIALQEQHPCYFFVADWHALTTHYEDSTDIAASTWDMVIDWLASGIDPKKATLFIQSQIPEHAELHLLLAMSTPLSWLERMPSYKDQQEKLSSRDLTTYGFLGYPLLQAADVLIYRASQVPVGEDQVPHIELIREIARRFNHLYGKESNFSKKVEDILRTWQSKDAEQASQYRRLRTEYQQQGQQQALQTAYQLLTNNPHLSGEAQQRLCGYLEGNYRRVLVEPQAMLTETAKLPGLDGQKMSKSYGNTIALRDKPEVVTQKIRKMPTDPARIKRTDPGEPDKCPVWNFHQLYSDDATKEWVQNGCRSAGIGCLECKQPVIDAINQELKPMQERAQAYLENPQAIKTVLAEGCAKARQLAQETMREVRHIMNLPSL